MAAYAFAEGHGVMTADGTGKGHSGTLYGSPVWTQGKYGGGLRFSGGVTQDRVRLIPDNGFDALSGGTIEAWVNIDPTTAGSFNVWFSTNDGLGCSYPFALGVVNTSGLFQWEIWAGDTPNCNATFHARLDLGQPLGWHHLAYVVGDGGNRWYVDGVQRTPTYLAGSASSKFFFSSVAAGLKNHYDIGTTYRKEETFKGVIDELRIYDRPLSQEEIQSDMATSVSEPVPTATPTNTPPPTSTPTQTPSVPPGEACVCNCDGVGGVTIDEVVKCVRIFLDDAHIAECPQSDRNRDGRVTIEEVVAGVNSFLSGPDLCPTVNGS